MALRDWFRRRVVEPPARAFEPPTYFAGVNRVPLSPSGEPSNQRLLDALSGWQAIATRAICDRFQSLEPIVVARRASVSGTAVEEELDDHLLKTLLDRPNPVMTRSQLLRVTAQWLVSCGEAYWLKVTNRLRVPSELWPLSPAQMEIVTDPDTQIRGYVFRGETREIQYERDEIVRFWMPHPKNPFLGVGNLSPQSVAYDASRFLDETMRDHFQNDATPKVALVAGDTTAPPTKSEKDAFEADWRTRYDNRRGTARRLPAIIPSGYTVHEFSAFGGMTDSVALLTHYRDQILMANGVPRSILGDVVDANRAAAETNQYVFDRHTILPLAELVADTLTARLAIDFDSKLTVRFRDFVADDKDFTLRAEAQDLATKVRTVNQVREDRGLDPVEWGDEPVGSIADVPYDPESSRDATLVADDASALDDATANGDEETPVATITPADAGGRSARASSSDRRGFFAPRREWSRVLKRERLYVPRARNSLLSIFTEQRRAVYEALQSTQRAPAKPFSIDDIFNASSWARLFRMRFEPLRREAYLKTTEETMLGLGLKASAFVLNERATRTMDRQGAALVTNVNAVTRARLNRTLTEGQAAGESVTQLVSRINRVFKVRRANAQTIARTEVLKAVQAAQIEAFTQSGVVERKQWNTSQDDAVRDSHQIDGQERDLNEAFTLDDGEAADAPGVGEDGADLSAANAINCRCFVTPA